MATAEALDRLEAIRHPSLLTVAEAGRRNRRTVDGVLLALGAVVVGLAAVIASSATTQDRQVGHAIVTVLGWADAIWRGLFVAAIGLALLVVADVLLRRRWLLARDIAVALVVELGARDRARAARSCRTGFPSTGTCSRAGGFPSCESQGSTAVLVVAGPELVRPDPAACRRAHLRSPRSAPSRSVRRCRSAALAGLAFGLGGAALVRLAFGTAAGVPADRAHTRRAGARSARRRAIFARPSGSGSGRRSTSATTRAGSRSRFGCSGATRRTPSGSRAAGAQLAYRDPRRSVAVGRVEQVEHEALATLMAARAGVRVPEVVIARPGARGRRADRHARARHRAARGHAAPAT